jgi:hypothetical protein
MRENRRHARVPMPGFSSKTWRIVVDPKTPSIECKIVDLSASGACLEVNSQLTLPKRFEFLAGGTRKKCNLIWRRGARLGVAF